MNELVARVLSATTFDSELSAFNEILKLVSTVNCRGAINRDGINTHAYDLVHIACVITGIKPVAYVDNYDDLILPFIQTYKTVCNPDIIIHSIDARYYLVCMPDNNTKAQILKTFLTFRRSELKRKYHYILGYCLGYPKADVDYLIFRDKPHAAFTCIEKAECHM